MPIPRQLKQQYEKWGLKINLEKTKYIYVWEKKKKV